MQQQAFMEMIGIHKSFGAVKANDNVNLSVLEGEIHAILGENGSGKSTLMNILSGIYAPDEGEIFIGGLPVRILSPKDAQQLGIGMVHQHFKLIDVLTAKENVVGGTKGPLFLKGKKLSKEVSALSREYGFEIDPDEMIYRMSVSQKQSVEILKTLYRGARLLILDEPTAVLTPQETRQLFSVMRNMRSEGCSIVFITHKLNEVMEISDRVSVLRKGRSIATLNTSQTNPYELTELMVGKAVNLELCCHPVSQGRRQPVVRVEDLTVTGPHKTESLSDVSFSIYSHEILGVAGIAGSGQKELCEALSGMCTPCRGTVLINGVDITGRSPREIQAAGITVGYVPEDRLGMGLVAGMSIVDNVILKSYCQTRGMFIDSKAGQKTAENVVEQYAVSTSGIRQAVRQLSGGNIQKVLLGREIELAPQLLITAYPVRGLDIGASSFVYDRLNEQKEKGVAVMMIGEDLDVLLGLCDRIAVLHAGKLMAIVDPATTSKEQIGLLMMGHKEKDDADA